MKVFEFIKYINRMMNISGKIADNLNGQTPIILINKQGQEPDFYFKFDAKKQVLLLIEKNEGKKSN